MPTMFVGIRMLITDARLRAIAYAVNMVWALLMVIFCGATAFVATDEDSAYA
jgi:hypothetical protein